MTLAETEKSNNLPSLEFDLSTYSIIDNQG